MNAERNRGGWLIAVVVAALAAMYYPSSQPAPTPPPPPPPSQPCPVPGPAPRPKPRPWGDLIATAGRPVEGGLTHEGVEVSCDLPASEKKKNVGGRDGAGLCVFTSIEYAARWQNEARLWDLQAKMRSEPGGGYPQKVDTMLAKYGKGVEYIQDTSGNLALLRAAIESGRMPGVTYGGSDPHYGGYVAHMVNLVHLDDEWAVISDNNFPGDNQYVWMSVAEFEKRWKAGGGGGWSVILLHPGPPPIPWNATKGRQL